MENRFILGEREYMPKKNVGYVYVSHHPTHKPHTEENKIPSTSKKHENQKSTLSTR
jgi:hypothetical protein